MPRWTVWWISSFILLHKSFQTSRDYCCLSNVISRFRRGYPQEVAQWCTANSSESNHDILGKESTKQKLPWSVISQLYKQGVHTNLIFLFFFLPHGMWDILVPQPGDPSCLPALKAWSFNHWTTRAVLDLVFFASMSDLSDTIWIIQHPFQISHSLFLGLYRLESTILVFVQSPWRWNGMFMSHSDGHLETGFPMRTLEEVFALCFLLFLMTVTSNNTR